MRKLLLAIAAFLLSFSNMHAEVVEKIGVPGPLNFSKSEFELAWTSNPTKNYFIQEYLPKGETPEHFNQMLSVFLISNDIELERAVQIKVEELEKRKKTDETCHYKVSENSDKTEYMVDFILGESKNDLMEIQEFNVYRYKTIDLPGGKKGLMVLAYSKRAYGDDITPFLKNLGSFRRDMLNEMIGTEMPAVWIVE